MFRSLRSTVTGLVAIAALAVTGACGLLPDAGPAVEKMQRNAAEQGLDGEVRFSARSIGGLGTSPHASVLGWQATSEDLERLLALLRQSEQVARDMKAEQLGVSVRMSVEGTYLELRSVPDPATGRLVGELLTIPHVDMVELYDLPRTRALEVRLEDGHADLVPVLGGRLRSLDQGTQAFARVDGMKLKAVVGGAWEHPAESPEEEAWRAILEER